MLDNLLMVADPKLIKAIFHEDEVVGFLFAFPDISAALQRQKGRLHPNCAGRLPVGIQTDQMGFS